MMVDKEFRRLKRKDLLQMLIMQCEETERLQQEVDQTSARLRELEASYERLKVKLDVKDDRLNQKDAKIAGTKAHSPKAEDSRERIHKTICPCGREKKNTEIQVGTGCLEEFDPWMKKDQRCRHLKH